MKQKLLNFELPHITIWILAGQIIAYALLYFGQLSPAQLVYVPALVAEGQWWRLFSFFWMPPAAMHPVFMAFAWYIFFIMGRALEDTWGGPRYTRFWLLSAGLTFLLGFLQPMAPYSNVYVISALFLAFATVYPNFELLLFFILPVKIKWLGYFTAGLHLLTLLLAPMPSKLCVVAIALTWVAFFGRGVKQTVQAKGRRVKIEKETRQREALPFHTCAQCSATEKSHPNRSFRMRGDDELCEVCLRAGLEEKA